MSVGPWHFVVAMVAGTPIWPVSSSEGSNTPRPGPRYSDCSAARRDFGYTPSRTMAEVTKLLHATYSEGEGHVKAGIA